MLAISTQKFWWDFHRRDRVSKFSRRALERPEPNRLWVVLGLQRLRQPSWRPELSLNAVAPRDFYRADNDPAGQVVEVDAEFVCPRFFIGG